jgi:hypothetical protein
VLIGPAERTSAVRAILRVLPLIGVDELAGTGTPTTSIATAGLGEHVLEECGCGEKRSNPQFTPGRVRLPDLHSET